MARKSGLSRRAKQILLSPLRVLGKAPKLYVKCMNGFADRIGRNCAVDRGFVEEAHGGLGGGGFSASKGVNEIMGLRCYGGGIGKIGRIDERRPCSFREDDVIAGCPKKLCPRVYIM